MAIGTGYNVKGARDLAAAVETSYTRYGQKISTEYQSLVSVLRSEWIGYDEQDFEAKLAQRICELYGKAYDLTKGTISDIETLINNWIRFQNKNRLTSQSGASVSVDTMQEITIDVNISRNDSIVQFSAITFSENDDLGLTSDNSYSNIKDAAETFKNNLKAQSKELFDAINPANAFFGDQTSKIKNYIEKVGESLEDITLAIKDLYDALDDLTKKSYKTQDNSQEDIAKDGAKALKDSSESVSNRWV